MIEIQIFLENQVDSDPMIVTKVPALPRKGDGFQMEFGRRYKVNEILFVPQKSGESIIQVWLENPDDCLIQSSPS